jgi:hypothetical protein
MEALLQIRESALKHVNDAIWLRNRYLRLKSLNDVVREQTILWRGQQ